MSKFIINEDFWALFPEARIAVVLASGIDNTAAVYDKAGETIGGLLAKSVAEAGKYLTADVFSENRVIAVWRSAYQRFKTKKGARCSVEALLKRVEKGTGIGQVNPLVDIYNAVSLTFGLPCGGEDIAAFRGDVLLKLADGGESFLAIGDEERDDALPGELVYKDDEGTICRCWNWRDGQRTMLTGQTTDAFLVIECVDPARFAELREAAETLASLAEKHLGGKSTVYLMDAANREICLDQAVADGSR